MIQNFIKGKMFKEIISNGLVYSVDESKERWLLKI